MTLTAEKRTIESKSLVKKARREGMIPAALYGKGQESQAVLLDGKEFQKLLSQLDKDALATHKITLSLDGTDISVLVKDIQYHPTTYQILHIDLQVLGDTPINVNVPIKCTHVVDCVGIKLGGVLRQVLRKVRVRCLPQDLPERFEIDIKQLKLHQKKKLKDIPFGEKVRPLVDVNQVVVSIAKR